MIMNDLDNAVKNKDFPAFKKEWKIIKETLTVHERQMLLYSLFASYYQDKDIVLFKDILDLFIDDKVPLEFSVPEYRGSLTVLSVHLCSKRLLQLLMSRNVKINHIIDAGLHDLELCRTGVNEADRYYTCLDFAYEQWIHFFVTFNNKRPDLNKYKLSDETEFNHELIVNIPHSELMDYMEQAERLHDMVATHEIIELLEGFGAKRYDSMTKPEKRRYLMF